jgi:hypothetical protein
MLKVTPLVSCRRYKLFYYYCGCYHRANKVRMRSLALSESLPYRLIFAACCMVAGGLRFAVLHVQRGRRSLWQQPSGNQRVGSRRNMGSRGSKSSHQVGEDPQQRLLASWSPDSPILSTWPASGHGRTSSRAPPGSTPCAGWVPNCTHELGPGGRSRVCDRQ